MPQFLESPPPNDMQSEDLIGYLRAEWEYLERLRLRVGRLLPEFRNASVTFNPSNLVDGAGETTTVTVPGALLGDVALASFSLDLQGITLTAYVSATDTVSVRFQNESGGAVNLASGTLRAMAYRLES